MSKIKICGLFRMEDVSYVNEAMPDYVGFIFAKSRRQISPDMAMQLSKQLDKCIVPIGVFANAELNYVADLLQTGVIRIAQLHGCEDEEYIHKLRLRCRAPIIKAVNVMNACDIERVQESAADYLLLDSGGGTGRIFDWTLIGQIRKPFFLAGGVKMSNIERALAFHPYGIDICSGVETNGLKDREKIITLVRKVRCLG
ncbi:phosphoribosylanthranilate isomerase [Ruminiclostridium herbifermentans]|uniref:N-(5'-phosphoribosyl)anthranilate isomerase n=1 Tax=Ruminiclostridium herbifermentans TaxID=2488810 RepID=A0A4U7JHP4_9FIRM|nr:phosphoribosylanthranilate isomerase [Ruminiclostridium herbifermentans]QNU66230.1 phosphoribosylanthranilate isomerase [Ruminiclostridium herbifermentans]